jgi:predicted DNA-binding transcriptional regulator YafY
VTEAGLVRQLGAKQQEAEALAGAMRVAEDALQAADDAKAAQEAVAAELRASHEAQLRARAPTLSLPTVGSHAARDIM